MKNTNQGYATKHKGFANSKPPARIKMDSRGDLEMNDTPAGHNKKELKTGVKNERNDPQGATRKS